MFKNFYAYKNYIAKLRHLRKTNAKYNWITLRVI